MQTLSKIKLKTDTSEKNLIFDFVILLTFLENTFIIKIRNFQNYNIHFHVNKITFITVKNATIYLFIIYFYQIIYIFGNFSASGKILLLDNMLFSTSPLISIPSHFRSVSLTVDDVFSFSLTTNILNKTKVTIYRLTAKFSIPNNIKEHPFKRI